MFEASHLQYHIVSGYIQIVSDGHYLPAFWAHPDLGGPFPGLVLLHDYWGLTAHVRSQARRFAELGYYVIAPDLFNRQVADTPERAQQLFDEVSGTALSYIAAALNALKSHHKCNSKIGLIGAGTGGKLALESAVFRDDLRALVIFYGLPDQIRPAEIRTMCCPMLGLFGQNDSTTPPERVEQLKQAAEHMNPEHEVVIYPDVGRGFFDDSRDTFQATAAQDAWNRAVTFLNHQLEVSKPAEPGAFDPGKVY
jgi:carboxymethylenebutenolidase